MSHYFVTPAPDERRHDVPAVIWGRSYTFVSSAGVFSANRLDPGTSQLFRLTEPPPDRPARFLDLGCGFGPIAVALADHCPSAAVDAVDVNARALELTTANARRAGVADRLRTYTPDAVPDGLYDEIWSNPPIRIGKPALHDLLARWLARLAPTGHATLVVGKHLGADSLTTWLTSATWAVCRRGSAKGFRVLSVRQPIPS
ncbi:MAG: methyltransferase [Propionibacteriaceae bacterium]|jgi:16S rRNA G1207 methylase RsmC|nr:methyltransferase [Propionibacteriaceae bacterium]